MVIKRKKKELILKIKDDLEVNNYKLYEISI